MTDERKSGETVSVTLAVAPKGGALIYLAWALRPGQPQIIAICTTREIAARYRAVVEEYHPGAVFRIEEAPLDHAFGAHDLQSAIYRAATKARGEPATHG